MDVKQALRSGMRVVGPDERDYGSIEQYDDSAVYVRGRRVPLSAIERVHQDRLYVATPELWHLPEPDPAGRDLGKEVRVPVLEERLEFGTREIDLGEIRVHKTVEEREEVRRGPLNREDVQVERIRVDRRVTAPEEQRMEGEWLVIPIMEEVYVVEKHLMVTEEIRIRKRLVTEEGEIRETVRRERASIEDTRVPLSPLLPEAVMPKSGTPPVRSAADVDEAATSDDAAWEHLHREIQDAGR